MLLINDTLTFEGCPNLSQFEVLEYKMLAIESGTMIKVSFELRRIFVSHIINTYTPTFGLLLIAVVTLQFDDSKMELALGLTLTIMLVMYTMYQSISVAVTKTAYLKFLDYWLFFCLLMPFVIFMIEIYWLQQKSSQQNRTKKWVVDENKLQRSKRYCKFITYAIILIFVSIYSSLSLIFYNAM